MQIIDCSKNVSKLDVWLSFSCMYGFNWNPMYYFIIEFWLASLFNVLIFINTYIPMKVGVFVFKT